MHHDLQSLQISGRSYRCTVSPSTLASKRIWTPVRGTKILKYQVFLEAFSIFLLLKGSTPSPDLTPPPVDLPHTPLPPPWQQVPFLGVCLSIQTLFPAAVTSLILQLHELNESLENWKSQQLNLLHSFSEKLHIKGSAGHFVNAVSLSTVLNRIMQSSINIEAIHKLYLHHWKAWRLSSWTFHFTLNEVAY